MRPALLTTLVLLTLGALRSQGTAEPSAPAELSRDERMGWWREARFGMFIHWGLYAIPAGEWAGKTDHGEWIRTTAQIPVETYDKLQPRWNPTAFDADAWAKMAADAGMKYLVITSKHHDGFCLFDSAETDWDVMNTPHGRDILAELAQACARRGVRFCTYHSIMDWHHPDYLPRRGWERAQRPDGDADFDRFERYLHAQVSEVVRRYDPGVMWFDGEWENTWSHERGLRLMALCRELSPSMIVNNRVDVHRGGMEGFSTSDEAVGDYQTPEQQIPATGIPGVDWESCMTMNRHWGWNRADTQWKSATDLVRNLIDIASKGGNYLLNVGPRADGTFPPEAVERLAAIGTWMKTNGEAIHGTTASVFDELPFGRCTVRTAGDRTKLYLHVFDWPESGELVLPGLANPVERAYRLELPIVNLDVASSSDRVAIDVHSPRRPDPIATVVVVEIAGQPVVYRAPRIESESTMFVNAAVAVVEPGSPGLETRYTLDGSEPSAASELVQGPIEILQSTTLRARAFFEGRAVSNTVDQEFVKVAPSPAATDVSLSPGLLRTGASVDWKTIPADYRDVLSGEPRVSTAIELAADRAEHVALRFTGYLDVPADDLYRFALTSDDGSKLWLDGELVVDNDGLHGAVEQRGARALAAGPHRIELVWFNRTGGAELSLRWARPGQAFALVAPAALAH